MTQDAKKIVREHLFAELFLSRGSGQHYFSKVVRAKAWNLIAWALIAVGVVGWGLFLIWKPPG